MANDGTVKIGTELDTSGLEKDISGVGSTVKKGLATAGTVTAGAAATGAAAFGALTKSALEGVASLEQNIGGVETLFGATEDEIQRHIEVFGEADQSLVQLQNREKTVLENANKAYKTAGLSANEYMSTVNSFAASLTSSLGDYAWAAGNYADMAVTDMADNANKMGTSMESIQNAYQGFAKQNYTMLDNLKLGYGGTKTEMERLLRDAEQYAGYIEGSLSVDSFADIVDAIHIVQEEMGITGTTAKEAASTIEGSMSAAKASWENFLAGSGTVDELVESVTTAAGVIFTNLAEIMPRLAETVPAAASAIASSIGENLPQFAEFGLQMIGNIAQGIVNSVPGLLEKGIEIVSSIGSGIISAAPTIIAQAGTLLTDFQTEITNRLPEVLTRGTEIITNLLNGLLQAAPGVISQAGEMLTGYTGEMLNRLPELMQAGTDIITNLLTGLANNAPTIIAQVGEMLTGYHDEILGKLPDLLQSGADMISNILDGLIEMAPDIIDQALDMMTEYLGMIASHLPDIMQAGIDILLDFLNGLIDKAPDIIAQAGEMLIEYIGKIASYLPDILQAGIELLGELAAGIISAIPDLLAAIPDIILQLGDAFLDMDWSSIGSNIISGIKNGVKNAAGGLIDAAVGAASDAIATVKGWLGIHSPSRRAKKEIGAPLMDGAAEGAEESAPKFAEASEEGAKNAVEAMKNVSAKDFVSRMQEQSYKAAENNEMAARSKWKNNGYDPEEPDPDGEITIINHFDVNGKPLVDETVKKTKREIAKEQRSNQAMKGDVAYA